jgi:CRP-like cAMP-binding protein
MPKTATHATIAVAPATCNRLLAGLTTTDFDKIAPWLEPMELTLGLVLHEPDASIQHVYFPTNGSVSMIIISPDGAVEVASVGSEGFAGVAAFLHAESMPTRAFVQAQGQAYRMEVGQFHRVVSDSPTMRQLFSLYTLAFLNQVAQSVACNRLHSLEARCARWLLMTHDRVEGDQIRLTQESLSYMLGVHRPAVTLAAGILQKAGFIDYARGKINIVDRLGLEGAACCCYKTVRDGFEMLLHSVAPAL